MNYFFARCHPKIIYEHRLVLISEKSDTERFLMAQEGSLNISVKDI